MPPIANQGIVASRAANSISPRPVAGRPGLVGVFQTGPTLIWSGRSRPARRSRLDLLSTHSPEQVDAACAAQGDARPDQLSVGPVWETPTKQGRPATGLELIEYAAREATIPWFAIGGIDARNVSSLVAAGARRIVVVRAIRDSDHPETAARSLRKSLQAGVGAPS